MSIVDIRRLPDEAFAATQCKACELFGPVCTCDSTDIDRDALLDCITDCLVDLDGKFITVQNIHYIVTMITDNFTVRLKP